MAGISRRDFFAAVGAGGVGAGAGLVYGEAVRRPLEILVPQVVPPEDFSPGIATWYNSVCRQCAAGCGISVRVKEGRAKKIEGNPAHPVNRGRLCALGQSGLNALYNPDRIRTPLKRTGERGSGAFEAISWDEAITSVGLRLGELKVGNSGNRIRLLTGEVRGHLDPLLEKFMAALGSTHYRHYEFADELNLRAAAKAAFGSDSLPYYDLANSDYVLSFGADYLGTWISPVHYSLAYGELRQGSSGHRGHCVQVEPRMSLTGANADQWIPATPGSEGLLALGLAHLVVAGGDYTGADGGDWKTLLADYAPAKVAAATGVAEQQIRKIASDFAGADAAVAIAGGPALAGTNGQATAAAVNALNFLTGNVNRRGGVMPRTASGFASVSRDRHASFAEMTAMIDALAGGEADVLIVHGTDPVFNLPNGDQFAEALAGVGMVVAMSSFMDDTTAQADLILPTDTYLEAWGDDVAEPSVTGGPVAAISQPVVTRIFDTRTAGDIVLSLARKIGAGLEGELPWPDMETYIRSAWQAIYASQPSDGDFDAFWRGALQAGVWGQADAGAGGSPPPAGAQVHGALSASAANVTAQFAGAAAEHPFTLQPYQTVTYRDGRGANLPWQQEMPDPLTSIVYSSWVELNPSTAAELEVANGDVIEIKSPAGSLRAPVFIYNGIRPDVVAMPIGQGHAHYGRYARGRGVNPIDLVATETDRDSGALAWSATRVSLAKTGEHVELIKTDGLTRTLGRQILHGESEH